MTTKQKLALFFNLAAAGAQIYASIILIINRGWFAFQYYTMDSNIFAAITSLFLIFALLAKGKSSEKIHRWRYFSTCCVTVTFLVVITILVPLDGWNTLPNRLFMGTDLWLHTVGPLLNIFSFIFLEREVSLEKNAPVFALIPTLIYAVIAIILNLVKVIDGPYAFLKVYDQGFLKSIMWLVVIGSLAYLIAFLLKLANTPKNKNN